MNKLDQHIEEYSSEAFVVGRMDCAHFVCSYFDKHYGMDLLTAIKPWENKREALKAIADPGRYKKAVDDVLLNNGMVEADEMKPENVVLIQVEDEGTIKTMIGLRYNEHSYLIKADKYVAGLDNQYADILKEYRRH